MDFQFNDTFGKSDDYQFDSIHNFPIVYIGTEQWIRETYPNFPEEFYPILALRNQGMKYATFKKQLRQQRQADEKLQRKKNKHIPCTIRVCTPNENIKF